VNNHTPLDLKIKAAREDKSAQILSIFGFLAF